MNTVKQRTPPPGQNLRSGDIRQNHELLDQSMRVQPFLQSDSLNLTVIRKPDRALRKFEVKWLHAGRGRA